MFRWRLKPVWRAGWDWWAQLKWKRIFSSGQSSAEMWIISINCKTLGSFFIFMHTKANQLCSVWRCWWNTQSLFIQNEGYGVSLWSTAETGSSAWQSCYFVHCHNFPSLQSSQHSSVDIGSWASSASTEKLSLPRNNPFGQSGESWALPLAENLQLFVLFFEENDESLSWFTHGQSEPDSHHQYTPKKGWMVGGHRKHFSHWEIQFRI